MQDYLFFYQLLLQICDVNNYGIVYDTRQNYFSDAETFSACYEFYIGILGSYGHNFKVTNFDELVKFDGVVIHVGVRGLSDGEFYRIWKYNGYGFDEEILNRINIGCWLQIKRVIKL